MESLGGVFGIELKERQPEHEIPGEGDGDKSNFDQLVTHAASGGRSVEGRWSNSSFPRR